ncbi:MAG: hypothetical protein RIB84_00885 [Sneathiellaceae bacterium]
MTFFWGSIPWMIEIAAAISAAAHRWEDFAIIALFLLINARLGFWEEHKADNAIEALRKRLAPVARVLRDGTRQDIPAHDLRPGDLVFLRPGNIVPADVVLLDGEYLSVDQSALMGESRLADLKAGDTACSGSVVRQGEMRSLVLATGMETYFGRTARLVETTETRLHFQQDRLLEVQFPDSDDPRPGGPGCALSGRPADRDPALRADPDRCRDPHCDARGHVRQPGRRRLDPRPHARRRLSRGSWPSRKWPGWISCSPTRPAH